MKRTLGLWTALGIGLCSANASAVEPTFEAGLGLPELVHLRMGAFATPRLSVQLYASNVVLNWLIGATATGYFLGKTRFDRPPPHALAVRGTVAFNPVISPIRIRGGGETLASAALVEGGYARTAASGFMLNVMLGAMVYLEDQPAAGPLISVGAGWVF